MLFLLFLLLLYLLLLLINYYCVNNIVVYVYMLEKHNTFLLKLSTMHMLYQIGSLAYVFACACSVFPISGLKYKKGSSEGFRSSKEM